MKKLLPLLFAAAAITLSAPTMAADEHDHNHATSSTTAAELPLVDAIVRKVDLANNKVMLSHGPIPNLNMAGMTMSFPVKDASWLQDLKPATKVRVAIDDINGTLTVVRFERK